MTNISKQHIMLALLLIGLQAGFWWKSYGRLPNLGVVPELASPTEMQLLAFGDNELYYRIMSFRMNNIGDTFGRFTPLKNYNLEKLYHWFSRLDMFDSRSNSLAILAANYFSQTQDAPQVIHMVNYLYEHSKDNPKQKWWWLTQATYLAMHKLKDNDLALKVASPLEGVENIPQWAQEMPAIVHEKRGEMEDAYLIMKNLLKDKENFTQSELNYMKYFMEERVHKLDEVEKLLQEKQKQIDAEAKKDDKSESDKQ
jgi:hypothetical protein